MELAEERLRAIYDGLCDEQVAIQGLRAVLNRREAEIVERKQEVHHEIGLYVIARTRHANEL